MSLRPTAFANTVIFGGFLYCRGGTHHLCWQNQANFTFAVQFVYSGSHTFQLITVFIEQASVYSTFPCTLGALNSIIVGAGAGEPGTASVSQDLPVRSVSHSQASVCHSDFECDHELVHTQNCQRCVPVLIWSCLTRVLTSLLPRLPPPIHSFRTALLHVSIA